MKLLKMLLLLTVTMMSLLLEARSGEYCEDFEPTLGGFWRQSLLDNAAHWHAASYYELKKTIPDFPEPKSGSSIVYLTPQPGESSVIARLVMVDSYMFPQGSTMYFRYWLRSQYPGSGTLEVMKVIGTMEDPDIIYSLTNESGPDVDYWKEVNITIPTDIVPFKLEIFAAMTVGPKNNIALDNISVYGPPELSKTCANTLLTA